MNWKTLLNDSGKIISSLSFAVLILSVLHDWGFYWIIGIRFQSVQTVYDHLANSIDWLPGGLATAGGLSLIMFGMNRLLNRLMGEPPEYLPGVREKKMREGQKQIRTWLPAIVLVVVPVWNFVASPIVEKSNLVFGGAGVVFSMLALIPILFVDKNANALFVTLIGASALILFTFGFGAVQAERSLKSYGNIYRVETRGGGPVTVNLLRSLEKGVLVWENAEQRTVFLKWDQIDRISHFVSLAERPALTCTYLRILCDPPPPIP